MNNVEYTIDFRTDHFARLTDVDRDRARTAVEAALAAENIVTTEQWRACCAAFAARVEGKVYDDVRADRFEKVQAAGSLALTDGWSDPDAAWVEVSA